MPEIILMGWDDTNNLPVRVKVTADGKLIINPTGFLENPPTEDEAKKAATSEWSYDHWKNASAHHAKTTAGELNHQDLAGRGTDDHHTKYTDADARASIFDVIGADGRFDKHMFMDYHHLDLIDNLIFGRVEATDYRTYFRKETPGTDIYIYGRIVGGAYTATALYIYDLTAYRKILNEIEVATLISNHAGISTAHHAKYTDAEAVGAFYNRNTALEGGTYTDESMTGISYVDLNPITEDIHIKGLADGAEGQIIFFVVLSGSWSAIIYHNSGDAAAGDKILTGPKVDITIADYQAFYMIYKSGYWICPLIG